MARISYSHHALQDLERLTDFLLETNPLAAMETVELIREAVTILKRHPLLGHHIELNKRELIISRGRTGYVALYSFEAEDDAVLILSVRHQREVGYSQN